MDKDPRDSNNSAIIVVIKNNKALIVQRSKTDYWMPLYWSLPGGHIMIGETPYHAGKRELKEETGLNANTLVYIGTKLAHDNNKLYLYTCSDFENDIQLNFEHSDYKWVSIDEIDDYKTTPKLKEFVALALNIPIGYY